MQNVDFNTDANRQELIRHFPSLASDPNFRINSPSTASYNCIAWAMGFEKRWVSYCSDPIVNAVAIRFIWWPQGVQVSNHRDALIQAFEVLGFEITQDNDYDPYYDKVVLYCKGSYWTHASRIVANGIEHSKFGELWDAYHSHDIFRGTDYGEPFAFMQRPHAQKRFYIDKFPLEIGKISINEDRLQEALNLLKTILPSP